MQLVNAATITSCRILRKGTFRILQTSACWASWGSASANNWRGRLDEVAVTTTPFRVHTLAYRSLFGLFCPNRSLPSWRFTGPAFINSLGLRKSVIHRCCGFLGTTIPSMASFLKVTVRAVWTQGLLPKIPRFWRSRWPFLPGSFASGFATISTGRLSVLYAFAFRRFSIFLIFHHHRVGVIDFPPFPKIFPLPWTFILSLWGLHFPALHLVTPPSLLYIFVGRLGCQIFQFLFWNPARTLLITKFDSSLGFVHRSHALPPPAIWIWMFCVLTGSGFRFSWLRRDVFCLILCFITLTGEKILTSDPGGWGRGILIIFLGGVCRPVLKTLTLFQTKIYDFQYPISNLTLKMYTLFQTLWGTIISTTLTKIYSDTVRDIVTPQTICAYFFFALQFPAEMLQGKSYPIPNRRNIYPILEQKGEFCTLFQTREARKWYPSGRHIPIWLILYGLYMGVSGQRQVWTRRWSQNFLCGSRYCKLTKKTVIELTAFGLFFSVPGLRGTGCKYEIKENKKR